ncbi:MAG: DPP IV N-terminal domain-containing protein [Fermentimonas sp.]|nr:DPP IV N-terminal domain-containing protein [Fermentimonas sp.]
MQRISFITLLIAFTFSFGSSAQSDNIFTLEQLIPGGTEYSKYSPRLPVNYQWNGNMLIETGKDSVWIYCNPSKLSEKSLLFTYDDILVQLKENSNRVNSVTFSREGSPSVSFNTNNGTGVFDYEKKTITAYFSYPEMSANYILSHDKNLLAYTKENNLYLLDKNGNEKQITSDNCKDIISGQSVHRNEFGINSGIFWSPQNDKIAFYRMDETMVTSYPIVDMSARVAQLKSIKYPMAGMTSHQVTIGVFDINSGRVTYLKTGEPDDHYLTNVSWSPDGEHIYAAELNREQNHLKLNCYNASSGDFEKTLFEEKHPKYVEPQNPLLFVTNKTDQFIWQSKRNGFNHLYLYETSGNLMKQLTAGEWEVTDVIGFDDKGNNLYFVSTNPTPLERHIFSVNLKNGKISQHSSIPGMHSASLSLSGRYLTDRFSSHDNPGEVSLIDTRNQRSEQLSFAVNPFEGYNNIPAVEIGKIKAADGKSELYYRLVKPADFDENKKYPVAVYVYGGPHSQMVNNRWRYGSGGWELYMAQKGYLVFVMDNRGTAYRGFDFENITHRQLGVEESKDQMKGVEFLRLLPYVDTDKMGIHGWSYGGFMTINMLLRYPDVFKVGVAGGPVTDWSYYEVMYGERYMDKPQENTEGYEETSLLNKADKLQSRLLIIHGDEDPTVVMQHSSQFIKACIKERKHPDLFVYPGHGHNMTGPDRVHLHEHITLYFDKNLLSL